MTKQIHGAGQSLTSIAKDPNRKEHAAKAEVAEKRLEATRMKVKLEVRSKVRKAVGHPPITTNKTRTQTAARGRV